MLRTPLLLLLTFIVAIMLGIGHKAHRAKAAPALAGSTVLIEDALGHGSGVHIGNGYIVTAAHVTTDNKTMKITDDTGVEQTGKVLWSNKSYDVALLRIEDFKHVKRSKLECAAGMQIGDFIEGVGNPTDLLFVHTWGRVATQPFAHEPWESAFAVDMTVVPGMSGGPVLNRAREVIGVMVGLSIFPLMQSITATGIGYVVPSSVVCSLLAHGAA